MKHALVIAAMLAAAGCARRMPPRATAMDAQRTGIALDELEHGRKLVVSKCGSRCHQPPMPNDHTAREWPHALDEMAPRAALSTDERSAIERYLVAMTKRP